MSTTGGIFRSSTATTSRLRVRLRSGFGFSFRDSFGNNRANNLGHLFDDSVFDDGVFDLRGLGGSLDFRLDRRDRLRILLHRNVFHRSCR